MAKLTALLAGLSLTLLLSAGCAVGPNYKRPSTDVPVTYRGSTPQDAALPTTESLGDQKWWDVFQDKQLQDLIQAALQQNYDVRIAATRILEAQAQLGITRSDQLPTISGGASAVNERDPQTKLFRQFDTSANQVDVSLAWELDFWGSTAAPPKQPAQICWQQSGHVKRSRAHWCVMLPQPTFSFVRSTCSSKFRGGR